MRQPKFGRFFTGPWPHDSYQGVGLVLTGYPTDVHAFIDLMHGESCNPIATRRILDSLETDGFKRTTVMPSLDFEKIGERLATLGVEISIVEPTEIVWGQEVDHAAFSLIRGLSANLAEFTDTQVAEIHRRVSLARRSMEEVPHDFGPYGR